MKKRLFRTPQLGEAFDAHQNNDVENVLAYVAELRHYRPRGFSKLAREGEQIARRLEKDDIDAGQHASEWQDDCDDMLTSWACRVAGHDYIRFGSFPDLGSVGFYIAVDSALEDVDLKVDDTGEVPRGFTGLVAQISDHGNVTMYRYSRGRSRELFAVV